MKELTGRQQEVLSFLKGYIDNNGYAPTVRETADHFDISIRAAYDHVKALEKKDVITIDLKRSRTVTIQEEELEQEELIDVPLLGNVAAGQPLMAHENFERMLKIPASALRTGEYFALRVKGDSMINAGILDGDLALIRKNNAPKNGEIVVARVNEDSVTIKRFFKEKNRIKLKAENPIYPPIYTQKASIIGCLATIIRDYH